MGRAAKIVLLATGRCLGIFAKEGPVTKSGRIGAVVKNRFCPFNQA
jgi:hypothetical protein